MQTIKFLMKALYRGHLRRVGKCFWGEWILEHR